MSDPAHDDQWQVGDRFVTAIGGHEGEVLRVDTTAPGQHDVRLTLDEETLITTTIAAAAALRRSQTDPPQPPQHVKPPDTPRRVLQLRRQLIELFPETRVLVVQGGELTVVPRPPRRRDSRRDELGAAAPTSVSTLDGLPRDRRMPRGDLGVAAHRGARR